MEMENLKLRFATKHDANKLLNIYAPYVKNEDSNLSDVSFEYVVPGAVEFAGRIRDIGEKYPYIVLERDGVIVGYSYAHPYIQRAAYQWSAETTIYIALEERQKGYGWILYNALERLLILMGITNVYACIAGNNEDSIQMHTALHYKLNGEFKQCAFKNGHWLDMVWMEKVLQEHKPEPEFIKSIKDVDPFQIELIFEDMVTC